MQNQKDALALLKKDHQEVKQLFKQAEEDQDSQQEIFGEIKAALGAHATIEEEIFYPAMKNARSEKTKDEVMEALAEHKQVKALLAELSGMSGQDESFAMKLKVLKEDVEHHVKEEEGEMFPDAKKYLGEKQLADLGIRMAARKQELMGDSEMNSESEDQSDSKRASSSSMDKSRRTTSKRSTNRKSA